MGGLSAKIVKAPTPKKITPPVPEVIPEPPTPGFTGPPGGNAIEAIQRGTQRPPGTSHGTPHSPDPVMAGLVGAAGVAIGSDQGLAQAAIEYAASLFVVEVREHAMFDPGFVVGTFIKECGDDGALLKARYGTRASGHIVIRWNGCSYEADPVFLPINDPELVPRDPSLQLGLSVWITDSTFHGRLDILSNTTRVGPIVIGIIDPIASQEQLFASVFGRSYHGSDSLNLDSWRNELHDGYIDVHAAFDLHPPDGPTVSGLWSYVDADFRFMAHGTLSIQGAEPADVEVVRTPRGILRALPQIEFAESWKTHGLTAGFQASFFDGSFEAKALLDFAYPAAKPFLNGKLTVVATTWERAWAAARVNDPSPHVTGGIEPVNQTDKGLALVAWGTLELVLAPGSPEVAVPNNRKKKKTEDLKASATFLVDPDGEITARGVLRLPDVYELIPAYMMDAKPWLDFEQQLEGANVFGPFGVAVRVFAKIVPLLNIGPVTLRDPVAEGTYSTRAGVGSVIELRARLNASAEAGIAAAAGIKTAATVGLELGPFDLGFDIGSVDIGVSGHGSIRGYVDAQTKVKRVGGAADQAPEYSLHGDLHIAGEIVARLGASASFSIDDLLSKQVSVGKELRLAEGGVRVTIDHVFGSGTLPKVTADKVDFDPWKFVKAIRSQSFPKPRGEKVHGEFHDRDINKDAKVSEGTPSERFTPPDRPFELHVPFAIEKHHHDLYLVVQPTKSVLEMSSPTREQVLVKIDRALQFVNQQKQNVRDADLLSLYENQIAELEGLQARVLELIHEADALAPHVEFLWEADLPELPNVASDLAEYGARYGDDEITGAARLLTGPLEPTQVDEESPEEYTYLGARRVDATDRFEGTFDDPAWTWTLASGSRKRSASDVFPTAAVTSHPVNTALGLQAAVQLSDLRPGGSYLFVGGGPTGAPDDVRSDLEVKWRRPILRDTQKRTDELEQQGMTRRKARDQAELEMSQSWQAKGFPLLRYDDLLVWKHTKWQCHHIHESSWDGGDERTNLIYLALPEHTQITNWFEDRKDDIKLHLDIE